MGSHCPTHCHGDNSSNSGISELCFAATAPGRDRFRHWVEVSAIAAVGVVLSEDVFALRKYQRNSLRVLGCPFDAGGGKPAIANDGDGCANRQSVSHSSDDHEQVQTVRIDYNINEKNTTWFRFQADTGVQAAYTDPINSLFDSVSPQPLYSFAAGYAHVFSQNVVNYFNPAFSWYASLFGPADFQKTLSAFPIVLQGSGANAFTHVGGLDNTWVQGRRASRFFINDNLAWSHGAHELRFGTNTRILRLNDYDFGQGTVPTVTYTTLPQYIYGVASTATKTFPTSANEPFNFLNLDLYAQDTWKVTRKLTWTFGIRDTLNSNPLNPHQHIARFPGSFDSISHDVNQPLNAAIRTRLSNVFSSTPFAILQPRTAIAWQFEPKTVLRGGFGVFSDILPGAIADIVGFNPPYNKTFQGGLQELSVGQPLRRECRTVRLTRRDRQSSVYLGFSQGQLSCASAQANPSNCLPPVAITAMPDGKLHAPYFMEWSLGLEHQLGTTGNVHAQYVGTRAVNQPYLTQVNGYQTVCDGCFAPFPYGQSPDPRFGTVTQFSTGANSHYHGLQMTATKRFGNGLMVQTISMPPSAATLRRSRVARPSPDRRYPSGRSGGSPSLGHDARSRGGAGGAERPGQQALVVTESPSP